MKKIVISILIVAVLVGLGYQYLYKDHRNIAEETAAYNMEASLLSAAFLNTTDDARSKYLDKTLTLSGKITETEVGAVILDGVVYCEFVEAVDKTLSPAKKITLKGRCIGYDELLEVVKLDQCTLIN